MFSCLTRYFGSCCQPVQATVAPDLSPPSLSVLATPPPVVLALSALNNPRQADNPDRFRKIIEWHKVNPVSKSDDLYPSSELSLSPDDPEDNDDNASRSSNPEVTIIRDQQPKTSHPSVLEPEEKKIISPQLISPRATHTNPIFLIPDAARNDDKDDMAAVNDEIINYLVPVEHPFAIYSALAFETLSQAIEYPFTGSETIH